MDGFGEYEEERERGDGSVVLGGLLATQCDALETLELSDGLLDPRAGAIERSGEVPLGRPGGLF